MICGLLIGKDRSEGVPGKNFREIVGRPMCEYGFIAARAMGVDRLFTSTDSPRIAEIGAKYKAEHIERPPELATPDALTEDALTHAADEMERRIGRAPEIVCLLFANNPAIDVKLLNEGVEILRMDETYDSAFSVCRYDMFSPTRARRVTEKGDIEPFVPLEAFDGEVSSIRSSQGGVYFCDLSVQVLRWRCFTRMSEGMQPFQWMGRKSKALMNDFGFDVDSEWQFRVIDFWLRDRGFTEDKIPYDLGDPSNWT
ncbi:cytidylyltransferase [Nitratireductor sp. XY-223]|uniref:acylneuraminate cytidylyltransferase family protein n=1 Tax=Nitratireductor sp. XY-223 TaxID=2561926 RepID=UPI0010AAE50D|nr:cytidylyltransferase [Nitratireductor sp. XY-223]